MRGAKLKQKETLETIGTVVGFTNEHIVAMCPKLLYYYLSWKGTEAGYRNLKPGSVVRIYYSGGFTTEVYAFEEIPINSEPS